MPWAAPLYTSRTASAEAKQRCSASCSASPCSTPRNRALVQPGGRKHSAMGQLVSKSQTCRQMPWQLLSSCRTEDEVGFSQFLNLLLGCFCLWARKLWFWAGCPCHWATSSSSVRQHSPSHQLKPWHCSGKHSPCPGHSRVSREFWLLSLLPEILAYVTVQVPITTHLGGRNRGSQLPSSSWLPQAVAHSPAAFLCLSIHAFFPFN